MPPSPAPVFGAPPHAWQEQDMLKVNDDLLSRPVDPVLRALAPGDGEDESSDDPLRTYLREIHEVNLLTARDERFLASRMEESTALEQLVDSLRIETAS